MLILEYTCFRASNYNLTVEDAKLLQTYAEKLSDKNTMDSDVDITTLQTKEMLMEITQLVNTNVLGSNIRLNYN